MNSLNAFENVCGDPYRLARELAANGRKVAGYMCSYSPQELLHAAGYVPLRIIGRMGGTPKADALMQSYICSFAHSCFDAGLSGEFDFLDVMLFAHTCDTMQNLADLWQGSCPNMKTIITALPNVHDGAAAATYLRKELDRVRGCIEEVAGPISDEKLWNSIRLYGKHREQMNALYALRRARPDSLTGTQMISVVLSSFLMPKEEHLEHLSALLAELDASPQTAGKTKVKVVVGGSVCQASNFISAIEDAGCLVADDDLCMGSRSFALPEIDASDPMDALTRQYLGRIPCPAIHKQDFDPAVRMIERVRESKAGGVVFLITKFCDPYLFDYPHISEQLEKAGIPALMLEIEQNLPVPEQLRTRMEAFVEILEEKRG